MSATVTTTTLFLLLLSLILLGALMLFFKYIMNKIKSNRNSGRKPASVRVSPQLNYEGSQFSTTTNFSNTRENLLTKEYKLFETSRKETGSERNSQEKLPADGSRNTSVFIKKPKRMTVLSAESAENDFSRPYYNVRNNEIKNNNKNNKIG